MFIDTGTWYVTKLNHGIRDEIKLTYTKPTNVFQTITRPKTFLYNFFLNIRTFSEVE